MKDKNNKKINVYKSYKRNGKNEDYDLLTEVSCEVCHLTGKSKNEYKLSFKKTIKGTQWKRKSCR